MDMRFIVPNLTARELIKNMMQKIFCIVYGGVIGFGIFFKAYNTSFGDFTALAANLGGDFAVMLLMHILLSLIVAGVVNAICRAYESAMVASDKRWITTFSEAFLLLIFSFFLKEGKEEHI